MDAPPSRLVMLPIPLASMVVVGEGAAATSLRELRLQLCGATRIQHPAEAMVAALAMAERLEALWDTQTQHAGSPWMLPTGSTICTFCALTDALLCRHLASAVALRMAEQEPAMQERLRLLNR